ncbi:MAG TPA: hypothetical protein VF952_11920 [Chloroflexia bacterium]
MKTTEKNKSKVRLAVLSGVITLVLTLVAVMLRQDVGPSEAQSQEGLSATSVVVGQTPVSTGANNIGRMNAPPPVTRPPLSTPQIPQALHRAGLRPGTIIAHSRITSPLKSAFASPSVAPLHTTGGALGYLLEEVPIEPPITIEDRTYRKVWRLTLVGESFITGIRGGASEQHLSAHIWIDDTYVGMANVESEHYQSLVIIDHTLLRQGARIGLFLPLVPGAPGSWQSPSSPETYVDEPLDLSKPVAP